MLKLVDFYASWCGQCRKLMPIIDEVAKEYTNITIDKVNIDDNMELAQKYSVSGLPCILIMKEDKVLDRIDGMITKSKLIEKIEKLL